MNKIHEMELLGKDLAFILQFLASNIIPGWTGTMVDAGVGLLIAEVGAKSSCLGYNGFPANLCVSVNDGIVHGIPTDVPFQEGDLVTLDLAINRNGYHVDSAVTFPVGKADPDDRHLLETTYSALKAGIAAAQPGKSTYEIALAVQKVVKHAGLTVIDSFCGHGIGERMHERFTVYNSHEPKNEYVILTEGETLAIEPIVKPGDARCIVQKDKWTIVSADGKRSAQFEHTVLVTANGPKVLTAWSPVVFEKVTGLKP